MIIVMLSRFFTQLWKLTDVRARRMPEQDISREIGVPPYFVKQYLEFRTNFDVVQIEQCFKALLEADTTLKSTSRDPRLVLDLLVVSLLQEATEHVAL
jgi:DNA polymerase-3 subunit delta